MTVLADDASRCIVAVDIPGFGSSLAHSAERASLRDQMRSSLAGAIDDAGIRQDSCHIEDRGDGALVLLPAEVGAEQAWRLVRSDLVTRVSQESSLRLRVALHRGPVRQDANGVIGESLNLLYRLLEARPLRQAMTNPAYNLGVIVSAAIHDELSTAVDGLEPIHVQIRDTETPAWISTVSTAPVSPSILDIAVPVREQVTFVGRGPELARLDELLAAADDASPGLVTITGPPGIGKTALARRWAELNRVRFGEFTVIDDDTMSGALIDEFLNEVRHVGRLLLLDDVARPTDWTRTLARLHAAGVSVILTTRSTPTGIGPHIDLGPLDRDDAVALLREVIDDPRTDREPAAITGLADLLGGLPLALSLAGESLAAWPGDSVAELLDRLREVGEHTLKEVFAYTYEGLDDDLKRAFRLTSVFPPGFDLTIAMTAALNDVDQQEAVRFLDDLGRVNLVTSADGERYRLHQTLVDFARERCTAEDTDDDREAARARLAAAIQREHMPEGVILRDHWTLRDALSYTVFIEAIAAFLTSPATRPPLTIGVKGAWGSGKTSLMRMLRRRLDPGAPGDDRTDRVTNRDVLRGAGDAEAPAADGLPTVWFNPWMYQRTEQVWAGLAHEIITQVTERLPTVERERFWLRLNRARVDQEAIRRRCYRLLFERIVPRLSVWLATLVVAVLIGMVALAVLTATPAMAHLAAATRLLPWTPALGVAVGMVIDAWRRWRGFWRDPAAGPLARLVQAPGPPPDVRTAAEEAAAGDPIWSDPAYRSRAGYLHAVYDDVRHVLGLAASERRPLVVFVDDLDRCDSRTVAEVIETLNVFLAGEFPNCVFVIAMEPAAVAAHIEAAHPDLVAAHRTGSAPGDWSSLGWRFLDKIVQLPLTLPNPRPEHVRAYVKALLRHGADDPSAADPAPVRGRASVDEAMSAIRERAASPEDLYDAARATEAGLASHPDDGAPARPRPTRGHALAGLAIPAPGPYPLPDDGPEPPAPDEAATRDGPTAGQPLSPAVQEAAMRVFAEMYDAAAAQRAVTQALPVLGSHNPREIKRFVNLFRFYSYIRLANQLAGQPVPDPPQLAKLTALVIRWPQLLSVLGTPEGEAPHPLTALERAAAGDDDAWREAVGTHLAHGIDGDRPAPWVADLRAFLARPPGIGPAAGML